MKFIFFIFLFSTVLFASSDFVTQVKSFFDLSLFEFDKKPISLASVIKALLYIVAGFLLGIFYKRWVEKISHHINYNNKNEKPNSCWYFFCLLYHIKIFRVTIVKIAIIMDVKKLRKFLQIANFLLI